MLKRSHILSKICGIALYSYLHFIFILFYIFLMQEINNYWWTLLVKLLLTYFVKYCKQELLTRCLTTRFQFYKMFILLKELFLSVWRGSLSLFIWRITHFSHFQLLRVITVVINLIVRDILISRVNIFNWMFPEPTTYWCLKKVLKMLSVIKLIETWLCVAFLLLGLQDCIIGELVEVRLNRLKM